ncbi:putative mediator of RNA polymerase II transcription subunitb [Sesamum angolense]|uniref:Mediator of RNA polymerase II transcription subunitb n=1 Tax=Sesamum angolense TaxID=2727404 RepID=A0AAE1WFQ4_9LAMI|nr:putative mediator of RNA polymerase II transcription subunitb [Sesamum angolense]
MATTPVSLDKWREYFRGANSDIFDIIEHAVMVAACDCPYDFKLKRDRIAEMLFTCKFTKCFGCDRVELAVPNPDSVEKRDDDDDKYRSGIEAGRGSKDTKESKVNDEHRTEIVVMDVNQISNNSYGDVEVLTDEIEESQILDEVLRIKAILDNRQEESCELLLDSLRRLQLMTLSVEILKDTEIGKSVNAMRKHGSKEIRNLVRTLIENWKTLVDAWVDATTAVAAAEVTTESVRTSVVEEEQGLPSPPLDEGALFATPTNMELSKFFDGMDDDGNPGADRALNKNQENVSKQNFESLSDSSTHPKDQKSEQKTNQESTLKKRSPPCKPNRPPNDESPTRRPKPAVQPKANNETKIQQKGTMPKKPAPHQQENVNCNDEASVKIKLEASKRKLHERYQEVEKAKKQRTIQVVELHNLPKQTAAHRNQPMRPAHQHRLAIGRR